MYKCQLLPVRKADQRLFSRFSAARLRTGCQLLQLSLFVAGKLNLAATHIHLQSRKNVRSHVNVHPPGFLNARSPEKEKPTALSAGRSPLRSLDGVASNQGEDDVWFELDQADWLDQFFEPQLPYVFFFNVWRILYDFVGCWCLDPDWKFNSTWLG